jgi:hypothetical protein
MTNKDLEHKLERLMDAINRIAAPIPAIPTIPQIPAIPAIASNIDDNRLTRVEVKIDQIQSDISDLKKQGTIYVTQTEHQELIKVCNDHETRIRLNETNITRVLTWGSVGILLVGILETGLTIYFH